ncbi:MAG: peroxidase family protein [Ardenticatenaceae bacterium]
MKTLPHGAEPTIGYLTKADMSFDPNALTPFKYYHDEPDLNTLAPSKKTVRALDALGEAIAEQDSGLDSKQNPDSSIPPIYTYWGQFIDHELTSRTDRDEGVSVIAGPASELRPVPSVQVVCDLFNRRTPNFDLDAIYGSLTNPCDPARKTYQEQFAKALRDPINPAKMRVGRNTDIGSVTPPQNTIALKRDLPRIGQIDQATLHTLNDPDIAQADHRLAFTGDPRNDENLIVAQFHTAILHFHNAVVDWLEANDPVEGQSPQALFERARKVVRWVFQWLVVNDFLMTIAVPAVVKKTLSNGAKIYVANADCGEPYMPMEFSTAAYRFGHAMIRNSYDYNRNFGRGAVFVDRATLDNLFRFTGGGPFPFDLKSLPTNWIIEWDRFTGEAPLDDADGLPARFARSIDTRLAPPLGRLVKRANDEPNIDIQRLMKHLARRNLRRGFVLSIPTGQAMAKLFGVTPLSAGEIRRDMTLNLQFVLEQGGFLQKTPLWYYILREAEINGGNSLGLLGSAMVAETFIGVMLLDKNSYLAEDKSWHPGRPVPGATRQPIFAQSDKMKIGDLLRFAGVL